jgi:hypothetical protein
MIKDWAKGMEKGLQRKKKLERHSTKHVGEKMVHKYNSVHPKERGKRMFQKLKGDYPYKVHQS